MLWTVLKNDQGAYKICMGEFTFLLRFFNLYRKIKNDFILFQQKVTQASERDLKYQVSEKLVVRQYIIKLLCDNQKSSAAICYQGTAESRK